jgi:hypothetical protein
MLSGQVKKDVPVIRYPAEDSYNAFSKVPIKSHIHSQIWDVCHGVNYHTLVVRSD